MRDLVVRQPHLGREAIVVLGRIADRHDDGLAQDDIEPYLLVRLLRCGYIRRQPAPGANFVATPAGIERWRFEALAAQRRQDDCDRREIIRGRLQTMIGRLELDYPTVPPPPALRDFGLPQIYQRERPALQAPDLPAVHVSAQRAARQARRIAGPEPRAAARDAAPRITPEAALSLIREGDQRAQRDSRLPVTIAGELLPPGGDLPEEHVGRLPAKRNGGMPAMRESVVPVARQNGAPLVPNNAAPLVRDNAEPAVLLAALVDESLETLEAPSEAAPHGDTAQPEMAEARGSGWRRAAVAAGVATVALLAAYPAQRYFSAPVEEPPKGSIASGSMPTQAPLSVANAVTSGAAAATPSTAQIHDAADRARSAPVAADKLADATVRAPAPMVARSGPAANPAAPIVVAAAPTVAADQPAITAPAPAAVEAAAHPARDGTREPPGDAPGNAPGQAVIAVTHQPQRLPAALTPGAPDAEKPPAGSATIATTVAPTPSAASASPAAQPAAEPLQIQATNGVPTPVAALPHPAASPSIVAPPAIVASQAIVAPPAIVAAVPAVAAGSPGIAPPSVIAEAPTAVTPVAGSSAPPLPEPPDAATELAAVPSVVAAASPAATTPEPPVMAKPRIFAEPADDAAPSPMTTASGMAARPVAASPAAAATLPATATASTAAAPPASTALSVEATLPPAQSPAGMAAPAAPPTAMATAPGVASVAAASAAASTAAVQAIAALPQQVMATPAAMTAPAVSLRAVEPSSPVDASSIAHAPAIVAAQAPAATASEPTHAKHRPDRPMLAAATKDTLVFASASVVEHSLPPLVKREAHAAPPEDPAEHVPAHQRAGQDSQDPIVDRLNALSLQAALQGKTFSPRAMAASLAAARRTVTSPAPAWPLLP